MTAVLNSFAQDGASNIEFVENKGQWEKPVRFKGDIGNGALFLEQNGFSALLYNLDDLDRITNNHHGVKGGTGLQNVNGSKAPSLPTGVPPGMDPTDALRSHAYRVTFVGGNTSSIEPDKILPGYNNYFIGKDPAMWASNCRVFQGVTYKNIYPNIDVRYYTYNGQLKYDIIVHPGGDVSQVKMKYDGVDKLSIKKNSLVTSTSVGDVTQPAPYSYVFDPSHGKTEVSCKYVISGGNTVSFKVDVVAQGATLIIDPSVVFCTFTGSKVSNWGFTATPGPGGSFFAGGIVFGSAFPWNTGALQPVYGNGQFDVGILKLNSSGSTKVYATYLGGQDSESPHSLFSDPQGNLVVLGRTYSSNFPFMTTAGPGGGADMFVAKINAAGTALIGCMRIGGTGPDCVNMEDQVRSHVEKADSLVRNYGDDTRSEVVIDASGNIIIAASSQSPNGPNGFPIVGTVFQPNFGGGRQDGVVVKLDPNCNHIIWSSFLGGSSSDAAFVLKANPVTGDIYVAGATASSNFPGDHSGVIMPAYKGGICDGFIAQISPDGSTLRRSTFLGTDVADAIYGLEFDKKGFPYVMGSTNGGWDIVNAAYSVPNSKQFIAKLQPNLSAYVYSTTFGSSGQKYGNPNISPVAFLVDRCENVYVSGWGGWITGAGGDPYGLTGTIGMPVTPDASKRLSDNRDFYFIVIQKNAAALLYATFFGQNDNSKSISEHVDGGTSRYDQNGAIYQAICANCNGGQTGRYPTTPGVWAGTNGAGANGCNLAAVKITFGFAGVGAGLRASVNGRLNDTSGCIPMDTRLEDTIRSAKSYIWNFGDGGPDTATTSYVVNHTYPNPGTYTVMMVAIDSNTCNVADTVYRKVIARADRAVLDFDFMKDPTVDCNLLAYNFTNQSSAPATKPFSAQAFTWDFGDNSARITVGTGPVNHSYANAGTYNVTLVLNDTGYCNYPDSLTKPLRVSPIAKAQFETPADGCVPYNAVFNNTSLGGETFTWDFGDGSPASNDINPTHLYANPGTYVVKLHEEDPNTCNKVSDTQFTITVHGRPKASFTYNPIEPAPNTPTVFSNESTGAVRYIWSFGDGDSTFKSTMDTVIHQYQETDTFQVCMVAINEFSCPDTTCAPVPAIVNPLLDVPNAFTPGRFGQNAILKVYGFGIMKMTFRIYNRWGKIVFQSDNPDVGWDGYFQGQLQPMDVYAYTLEADFSDGKHVSKKGDITLVR
ncbi:MAG: PKD domain-containing protein [Bacteroidetes bacterium]|nr:PKD domain-containing protein [Bacteroidota bacterium]